MSVEPSGGRIWVTSEDAGAVFVIDLAAHKVVKSVKVGTPTAVGGVPAGEFARLRAVGDRRDAHGHRRETAGLW